MGNRNLAVPLFGLLTFGALLSSGAGKPQVGAAISRDAKSPSNLGGQMPPSFNQDVARVVADIDRIEADTLSQMERTTLDRQGQVRTLGKLLLFDKRLSVNQNEACSFCHTPETGFTGPIQSLNETTVSYPGSVRTRFSNRKPQSYMYAPFAPVFHYNTLQGDFVGGNFWDMRASGYRLQNPSAEQAQGPPTNPVEMGLPDSACVAYRLSQAPYRKLFETVWGSDSFNIHWPNDVEKACTTPGPPPANDKQPVHLNSADRTRADQVYDQFGLAISAYEFSPEVSPKQEKINSRRRKSWATSCSVARRDAMSVIAMAGPGKSLCLRTLPPVISASPEIRDFNSSMRASPTNAATAPTLPVRRTLIRESDPSCERCKAIAVNSILIPSG